MFRGTPGCYHRAPGQRGNPWVLTHPSHGTKTKRELFSHCLPWANAASAHEAQRLKGFCRLGQAFSPYSLSPRPPV